MNYLRLSIFAFVFAGLLNGAFAQKSVADVRKLAVGDVVENVGIRVTVANQFRNTCFAQDGTAGIALFNTQFRNGVKVGDSVLIQAATITEFQATTGQPGTGLLQFSGNNFKFIVVPVPVKEELPKNIAIPAINESVEGQLVRVRGVEFVETGAFQGETNYTLKNQAGNTLQLRIDGNTEIATNQLAIPTGRIDVIGVISQFRGTYQLQPRFAIDLGLEPPVQDTVNRNRTLDVTTWNLYWFGDTATGPSNRELQLRNAVRAMNTMNNDIFGVQEIAKEDFFVRLRDTLQGNFGGFIAKGINQAQRTGWLYRKSTVQLLDSGLAVNGGSQAWASGRFPYRFSFRASIDGKQTDMHAFVIHAKATDSVTAIEDRNRREQDASAFYTYLQSFYGDKNVIILGDFNDDVLRSTIQDGTYPSPYKIFVDKTDEWTVTTKHLSEKGLASYIRSNRSMIDHIIVSNEIAANIHRSYIETPNAYISSYTSTTSDHLPVTARIFVPTTTITSVENEPAAASLSVRCAPNPAHNSVMVECVCPTQGYYSLALVNYLGETVHTEFSGTMDAGIIVRTIPTQSLASGIYTLVLTHDNTISTQQIQVTH